MRITPITRTRPKTNDDTDTVEEEKEDHFGREGGREGGGRESRGGTYLKSSAVCSRIVALSTFSPFGVTSSHRREEGREGGGREGGQVRT